MMTMNEKTMEEFKLMMKVLHTSNERNLRISPGENNPGIALCLNGIYIIRTTGLSTRQWFIGLDKDKGEVICEEIGV
jgi:hypothetical protein